VQQANRWAMGRIWGPAGLARGVSSSRVPRHRNLARSDRRCIASETDYATSTMARVFVDGQEGTTGLEIQERLVGRRDLELVTIEPERRKDPVARRACIDAADVTVLCLPDAAAKEAVALATRESSRFIDASTAHRTAAGWVYGLPELDRGQRDAIRKARYVSNPGCHATGFVLLVRPLLDARVITPDQPIAAQSITGYSGGGKKLIKSYREGDPERLAPPRPYSLGLLHKHLPEMRVVSGLTQAPLFMPVLGPFYRGMLVCVPLVVQSFRRRTTPRDLHELFTARYAEEPFVKVMPLDSTQCLDDGSMLSPLDCNLTNRLEIFVFGHEDQILCVARFDNLGKGASGAAVQNLNLMIGAPETTGLVA
jgi:N-acetyl-gamma-glutamyl-phosphate reductase